LLALEVVRGVFCNKTRGHDPFFSHSIVFVSPGFIKVTSTNLLKKKSQAEFFSGSDWSQVNRFEFQKVGLFKMKKKQNTTLLSLIFNQVKK